MFRFVGAVRLKRVLAVLGAVAGVLAVAVGGGVFWVWRAAEVSTVGAEAFDTELRVPPVAPSRVRADGTRVFDLRMQAGSTEFRPGAATSTWGFNGGYLGPTLRARRGERVEVNVRNGLDEPSTVHWHGMHLPAAMDGGPHQPVPAGGAWTPSWTVNQPAATLWYHPHPHGGTEQHVQRGLAGMFLVDDDATQRLALPHSYGADDLPLIVQDVKFRGAQFDHGHAMFRDVGFLGTRTMVNGTLSPYRRVDAELVRLRLLNASAARVYAFGFADNRDIALVGTDGGLLSHPETVTRVPLSPGERAEVVVRMRPGETAVLRSYPPDGGGGFWGRRFSGGDDCFDVLQLRAARQLRPAAPLPATLTDPELPDARNAVRKRDFDLAMATINGRGMDMSRVDHTIVRGTTELWTVRNQDGMPHNFHVHDVQFRVVDMNGAPPLPTLRGPKDTVFLPAGATATLALRFDGPPDPDHPYMYHCHLLYHEDLGMMGQFVVVEPGQQAGAPPYSHHGH
ncbi:MAG: multicopper oxidase domain-containing protein [Mycobacteriaceae bacterium]|nr:multicopper oxidase domain-containing protein [Mycobacteriaceae bacterium]